MTGWRKRQIYDSQMSGVQDAPRDHPEPISTHAGCWPHEAVHMLRVSPSTQAGITLLRSQPVVDVLRGGTGRREAGPAGVGSGESMANTRQESKTK